VDGRSTGFLSKRTGSSNPAEKSRIWEVGADHGPGSDRSLGCRQKIDADLEESSFGAYPHGSTIHRETGSNAL